MDYTIAFALMEIFIFLVVMLMPILGIMWIIRLIARPARKTIRAIRR